MSHHGFFVPRKVHACKPLRFWDSEAARDAAWWSCVTPNVRVKPALTVWRAGPVGENVQRTAGRARVTRRWRSA